MSLGAYRYFGMQVQHGKGLAEQNLDRMAGLGRIAGLRKDLCQTPWQEVSLYEDFQKENTQGQFSAGYQLRRHFCISY